MPDDTSLIMNDFPGGDFFYFLFEVVQLRQIIDVSSSVAILSMRESSGGCGTEKISPVETYSTTSAENWRFLVIEFLNTV